ncbi:wHTH domain-containing protein [Streptomyces sp. NPDC004980]
MPYRALLLFVPAYEAPEWTDLGYLHGEFRDTRRSLDECGYAIDGASDCREFTRIELQRHISDFIEAARPGERLLVYLSGHGFQHHGDHWFAAHDSSVDTDRPTEIGLTNLSLDEGWSRQVENSHAEQVLFVVDACRDRLEPDSGHPLERPYTTPPDSEGLSFLLACAPRRTAAFVAQEDVGYSLFTRALRDVLADAQAPLSTLRLRGLLDDAMRDLRGPSGPGQEARLVGEVGGDPFEFLPPAVPATSYPTRVWDFTEGGSDTASLRVEADFVAQGLANRLADDRKALLDDLWLDWGAGARAAARLEQLLGRLPAEVRFTPAETAVLALAPALYHGFRVACAVDAQRLMRPVGVQHPKLRSAWERYPRLDQQTNRSTDPRRSERDRLVAQGWVVHQSEIRDSSVTDDSKLQYFVESLAGTEQLATVFHIDFVAWLFRSMREGAGVLVEPPGTRDGVEIPLRRQLIGYLLTAAQIMALDLAELPQVLVENSGGHERVGLAQVRRDIAVAEWEFTDRTVRLSAECGHQAVMVALQERVGFLDGLIGAQMSVPGELASLPSRASADEVTPAKDADGNEKFLSLVTRFGLDGPRVRELLIGEQLYGSRTLAVRELYQNAMDACEVRLARETLQNRPAKPSWEGRIEITQGQIGNRRYLECVDNGSGMGREELVHAFAQGGARLSHLSPFMEERRKWESQKIPFRENSRFGIGVLSYFMLADEIEVVTRKFLKKDAPVGAALSVWIGGPDHLFQVRDHPDAINFLDDSCGTRVRWYLRGDVPDDFSCVRALRAVLGVTRFVTTATGEDGADPETWQPDDYRSRPDTVDGLTIDATEPVVPDPDGHVYWCAQGGALLVDGIATRANWYPPGPEPDRDRKATGRMEIAGAVVNLQGPVSTRFNARGFVPRLKVDRSEILDDVFEPIRSRLKQAARSLAGSEVLTVDWLHRTSWKEPRIADAVVEGLVACDALLTQEDGGTSRVARTGYFPADSDLRANWDHFRPPVSRSTETDARERVDRLPAHLALWRYHAHFPEDVARALGEACPADVLTTEPAWALPSDAVLLGGVDSGRSWDRGTYLADALGYADRLNELLTVVLDRLAGLGLPVTVPRRSDVEEIPRGEVLMLLSRDGDADRPWLRAGEAVTTATVLRACEQSPTTPPKAVRFLRTLGYDTSRCSVLLEPASAPAKRARSLLSIRGNDTGPYLSGKADTQHVVEAAGRTGSTPREVRAELESLGASLGFLSLRDQNALSVIQRAEGRPGPESAEPLTVAHVFAAAQALADSTGNAALLLEALGHTLPDDLPPDGSAPDHADLLNTPLRGGGLYMDLDAPVSLPALFALARRSRATPVLTAQRLRSLGVDVPFEDDAMDVSPDELAMLNRVRRHDARIADDDTELDPRDTVPLAHMVHVASERELPLPRIAARLEELGMRCDPLPDPLPPLPGSAEERALVAAWVPYTPQQARTGVPVGRVYTAAEEHGWTVPDTVSTLRRWGLRVAEPEEAFRPGPQADDLTVLSVNTDGGRPWVDLSEVVSTDHVVRAARTLQWTAETARERLLLLGARISRPEEEGVGRTGERATTARRDEGLFRTGAWGAGTLFGRAKLPAAYMMIMADENDLTVLDVADRLRAAGFVLDDHPYPDELPVPEDLLILCENAFTDNDWLPLEEPVGLEHLLVTAHRLGTEVDDIADRMRALGYVVPPVAQMVQDAWDRVPKAAGRPGHTG